jgi:hypothetical protein
MMSNKINLDTVKSANIKEVEFSETGNTSEKMYNHHQRRKMMRDALRNKKIPIKNPLGLTVGYTNQLRIQKNKELNLSVWLERIKKAQEIGKQIHRINEETNYRRMVAEIETKEASMKNN